MDEINKMIETCNAFKRKEFGIKEFQERIGTIYLPDECKHTLERLQHNAHNELEKIIYCYGEDDLDSAKKVANKLIRAANLELERIGTLLPYAT